MNTKKRMKSFALLLTFLLTVSLFPMNVAAEQEAFTLTIIHINDRHGRMDADPYISQLAAHMKGSILILDARDALHGQTTANLSKGETMVELMNAVGYDAMVPGNHDFNFALERLIELSDMMDFPLLSANVMMSDGKLLFKPYEVFDIDGIKVGVFGITTPETLTKTNPRIVSGLRFDDPATVAANMVAELQAQDCDIIVALSHLGVDASTTVSNQSKAVAAVPGVDVVIDGHSHTAMTEPVWVGDTLIAQAGWAAEYIGVAEITILGDKKEKSSYLIAAPYEGLAPDESIVAKMNELNTKNESITSVIVDHTPVLLQGDREYVRKEETNLANLVTDSMKWATGADIAFLSGGNIRESIEAGDITMEQILTVLPFPNLLVTVELSGADLMKVLEHGVSEYPEPAGSYIQVSGLRFTFDPDKEAGQRVQSVTMADGSVLDVEKTYTVATNEYLAVGGDEYSMMANNANLIYYGGDADAFAAYLTEEPAINAEPEWRVQAIYANEVLQELTEADTHEFKKTVVGGWIYISVAGAVLFLAVVIILIHRFRRAAK